MTHTTGAPMTAETIRAGEVRTAREYLGLSRRGLAQLLRVSEATVQNWEKGKYAPPQGVVSEIRRLESVTARTVQAVLDAARARQDPVILVYRQDEDVPVGPARALGASWWRAVVARVRDVLGPEAVAVGYADEFDALTGSSREQTLRTAIGPGTVMARG